MLAFLLLEILLPFPLMLNCLGRWSKARSSAEFATLESKKFVFQRKLGVISHDCMPGTALQRQSRPGVR